MNRFTSLLCLLLLGLATIVGGNGLYCPGTVTTNMHETVRISIPATQCHTTHYSYLDYHVSRVKFYDVLSQYSGSIYAFDGEHCYGTGFAIIRSQTTMWASGHYMNFLDSFTDVPNNVSPYLVEMSYESHHATFTQAACGGAVNSNNGVIEGPNNGRTLCVWQLDPPSKSSPFILKIVNMQDLAELIVFDGANCNGRRLIHLKNRQQLDVPYYLEFTNRVGSVLYNQGSYSASRFRAEYFVATRCPGSQNGTADRTMPIPGGMCRIIFDTMIQNNPGAIYIRNMKTWDPTQGFLYIFGGTHCWSGNFKVIDQSHISQNSPSAISAYSGLNIVSSFVGVKNYEHAFDLRWKGYNNFPSSMSQANCGGRIEESTGHIESPSGRWRVCVWEINPSKKDFDLKLKIEQLSQVYELIVFNGPNCNGNVLFHMRPGASYPSLPHYLHITAKTATVLYHSFNNLQAHFGASFYVENRCPGQITGVVSTQSLPGGGCRSYYNTDDHFLRAAIDITHYKDRNLGVVYVFGGTNCWSNQFEVVNSIKEVRSPHTSLNILDTFTSIPHDEIAYEAKFVGRRSQGPNLKTTHCSGIRNDNNGTLEGARQDWMVCVWVLDPPNKTGSLRVTIEELHNVFEVIVFDRNNCEGQRLFYVKHGENVNLPLTITIPTNIATVLYYSVSSQTRFTAKYKVE